MLQLLGEWGKEHIQLGDLDAWEKSAQNTPRKGKYRSVVLWIDSTDFRLVGKRKVSRRSRKWSFKLNSPGQRFMMLMDAKRRIRGLWGGYSPKVYDADWMHIRADWFNEHTTGASIIGDSHFTKSNDYLEHVNIVGPPKKPKPPKGNECVQLETQTKAEKSEYQQYAKLRARVESPFAPWKTKWKSLAKPWREERKYQNALVFFIAGVHNYSLK
eukprot:CAMPEP_0174276072 /NCGR_PEP_ID=MMETSP0439-20130205/60184_1 /TAXON_ID=0 /ORGANISM="Stereomyxa ramosa, Strain Chinc5" /LENGTH=213 /DNA_ID=CAMNT_0015368261 /DNA_START=512 /DNA_END=1153 /DNA_ORIENTATION=+